MPKYYPLGDSLTREEKKHFDMRLDAYLMRGIDPNNAHIRDGYFVVAVTTNECRPPKRGEWYLSGANPCAYRAPNDLSSAYWICKLVKIEKKTTVELVEIQSG